MANWTTADIPRPTGRLAVITGATGGLGFKTALALAGAGADVVLSGRNAQKGQAALDAIRAQYPAASIHYAHLDLASLASLQQFAAQMARYARDKAVAARLWDIVEGLTDARWPSAIMEHAS